MNGPHLDDVLSALVDGELAPVEEAEARVHVAACEPCRAELAAVEQARSLVRSLPELDLPPRVVERVRWLGLGRRRPSRVAALAAGAAAAAAAVLFSLGAPQAEPVSPKVGQLVEVHATSGAGGDPLSRLTPAAVPVSFEDE